MGDVQRNDHQRRATGRDDVHRNYEGKASEQCIALVDIVIDAVIYSFFLSSQYVLLQMRWRTVNEGSIGRRQNDHSHLNAFAPRWCVCSFVPLLVCPALKT